MKKFLLGAALTMCTIASTFACWFTELNYNTNYIAGFNNYVSHYVTASTKSSATYTNNMSVDLPLTVWIKVSSRSADQQGESNLESEIKTAKLQYRVKIKNQDGTFQAWSAWTTVKTIENVKWKLSFANPVALFGRNNINPKNLTTGSVIMVRLWLSDGIYTTGQLSDNGPDSLPNTCSSSNPSSLTYTGGWTAPFITTVIYSGKKRPVR